MSKRDGVVPVEQSIGPELKRLREAAGLSVRTLAERAGFSASFLSQVEHGQVAPSIASLGQFAATLNVSLAEFFTVAPAPQMAIVRADNRPAVRGGWSRARAEDVMPAVARRSLDSLMVTLEPHGTSGRTPIETASDQLAIVFAGAVLLTLADEPVTLRSGDTVLIPAGAEHHWHNPHRRPAQILLVSGRPTR